MFLYFAWCAFLSFVFAVFFAYLLEAAVSTFQVWFRGSRPAAITVVYVLFIGVLVLVFSLLGPPVAQETEKLARQAPEWATEISSGQLAEQVGTHYGWGQATGQHIHDLLLQQRESRITANQHVVPRAERP